MTPSPAEVGAFLVKYLGYVGKVPAGLIRTAWVATLSTAEILLEILGSHYASDFGRLKEPILRKQEAKTREQEARAEKALAEAAEASNRATLHKRRDRVARLAREQTEADLDLNRAHADLVRARAEGTHALADALRKTVETPSVNDARNNLVAAILRLKQSGGDVFLDEENLRQILQVPPPAEDEDPS